MITLSFVLSFLSMSLNPHNIIIHNPNASTLIPSCFTQFWVKSFLFSTLQVIGWHSCCGEGRLKREAECCYDVRGNIWQRKQKGKVKGRKQERLKASVGKYLCRASQTSEHIDREASSIELTLCLVCKVLLVRTFDIRHEGPKNPCQCRNKVGANSGSKTECVLI